MDIRVKKCERCGDIYNLEYRKVKADPMRCGGSAFDEFLFYADSHDKVDDFCSIRNADGILLDFCHDCALAIASSIGVHGYKIQEDSHENISV